jgi:hypothetical protein
LARPWDLITAKNFACWLSTTFTQFGGNGSNGGGGAGGYTTTSGVGGGGGGSGGNGGFVVCFANTITVTANTLFQTKGGTGGNGGNSDNGGGGAGAAGGNGGYILVVYRSKSGSIITDVTAGAAGTVGTGTVGTPTQATGMVAGTALEIAI